MKRIIAFIKLIAAFVFKLWNLPKVQFVVGKIKTLFSAIVVKIRKFFRWPGAQAKNAQESLSVSVGQCVATFVSILTGESISFGGETFYNEEDLLGDITLDTERAKRYMSADGSRDVLMQSMSRAGTREIKFLLGENLDKLKHWGQSPIQKEFNFDFLYKYNTESAEGARIQRHKRCVFIDLPLVGVGRDRGYITAKISFGDVAEVDPTTDKEI